MARSRVTQSTVTSSIKVIVTMVALMASVGKQDVMAQSSCNSVLLSLSPCLNYITGSQATPSQGCCSALATVVTNNAPCLCQLLTGNNSLGIPINQTRALALPGLCQITTPPVSRCQGSGAPAASPSPTGSVLPPTGTRGTSPSPSPALKSSASSMFVSPALNFVVALGLAAVVM